MVPETGLALWGSGACGNVAKTLEISTFAKIKLLWLQCEGPPHQRRCSHSNIIFATPYKTYEILILFWSRSRFPYKNT